MKRFALAAVGLLLAMGAICATTEPLLREGLWSNHSQTTSEPGGKKEEATISICRNHAYDQHLETLAHGTNCKTISDGVVGNTRTIETECTIRGTVMHSKTVSTMNGDTAHSEMRTTYNPPMYGMKETTRVTDSKYVGACPAGTGPGDLIGQDGKVIHTWKP